jgi:hypothetical protein
VALWAVQVREIEPPDGVEPIEWLLLTTVAVQTVADAIERVEWYACRWGIELFQSQDIKLTWDAFFFYRCKTHSTCGFISG